MIGFRARKFSLVISERLKLLRIILEVTSSREEVAA